MNFAIRALNRYPNHVSICSRDNVNRTLISVELSRRYWHSIFRLCSYKSTVKPWPRSRLSTTVKLSIIRESNTHCVRNYHGTLLNLHQCKPCVRNAVNISFDSGRSCQIRSFSLQSIAETQAGWFKSLSDSTVVSYAQDFFLSVHGSTGLPWWASIVLTTVLLRTFITLPLGIYQNYILAKIENLQLEMPDIVKELKMETVVAMKKYNWTEKQARVIYNRSLRKQWKLLLVRDNCHPFKASLPLWVQLPMWVVFSTALRNLVYMLPQSDTAAQLIWLELSVGGFGWIPNLTAIDSSLVMPVAFGLVNLAIIELQAMTRVKQSTKLQRYLTNAFRGLSVGMIFIAANVPACLCLYWTTSSVYGLAQNLALLSPRVKRWTGIPVSASQLDRPYEHIAAQIRQRAGWLAKPFTTR